MVRDDRHPVARFAPLIALATVTGLLMSACGETTAPVTAPKLTPLARRAPTRAPASRIPAGPGALVALLVHTTTMRASPGGRRLAELATRTEFGSLQALWVVDHRQGWLAVISPQAGNGHVGWILQSATQLLRNRWQLRVSLAARQLTVLYGTKVLARFTVAIGPPQTPTPVGRFAVTDRLVTNHPDGPYGCCILALSARAPHAIQGWSGGDRIAIHSTPDVASIGQAVSHGCIRVTLAEGRWLLNHVPLATPTRITA